MHLCLLSMCTLQSLQVAFESDLMVLYRSVLPSVPRHFCEHRIETSLVAYDSKTQA